MITKQYANRKENRIKSIVNNKSSVTIIQKNTIDFDKKVFTFLKNMI